jgi:hypothetical protein
MFGHQNPGEKSRFLRDFSFHHSKNAMSDGGMNSIGLQGDGALLTGDVRATFCCTITSMRRPLWTTSAWGRRRFVDDLRRGVHSGKIALTPGAFHVACVAFRGDSASLSARNAGPLSFANTALGRLGRRGCKQLSETRTSQ